MLESYWNIAVSAKFSKNIMALMSVIIGDVWFSLNGVTYQNNSVVTLEDIGERDDALLCMTNLTACCRPSHTGENVFVLGNWFFPNGTRVPSNSMQWNFYRDRGCYV